MDAGKRVGEHPPDRHRRLANEEEPDATCCSPALVRIAATSQAWVVKRLLDSWVDVWRSRPIFIHSTLPPEVAISRMKEGAHGYVALLARSWGSAGRIVTGSIRTDRIRLVACRRLGRNSWRPVLHAQILAASDGCELVGSFQVPVFVQAFTAVWLSFAGLSVVMGLLATLVAIGEGPALPLYSTATGSWSGVAAGLGFTGLAACFVAFGVGLAAVGSRIGLADEQYLRTWLAERLGGHPWASQTTAARS